MTEKVQADYLIVGSGGMGMAFADTLMTETDASIIMVDRHGRPGGHWNDAYPFVRLHQPSAFYGVNSRKLGNDTIDKTGWNEGLYELASASEVVTYFDQVMQQQFLPSGRLQYFPMCEYAGDGKFSNIISGARYEVAAKKTVDSTYMDVQVPSMREPRYEVADGMQCVAPNELPRQKSAAPGYVLIGAGKTAMDAGLWLLANGVDPDLITWIMPRDSWMFDRAYIQPPGIPLDTPNTTRTEVTTDAIGQPRNIDDVLEIAHQQGTLFRFDDEVRPTMWRCATVTKLELAQLRRIKNIVRKGRVRRITRDVIDLEQGDAATSPAHLHIDCTADGLAHRPVVPVFQGDRIVLQSVKTCQQVFSAAFIGHIEAQDFDEAEKNRLCAPVPHPDNVMDFLRTNVAASKNWANWYEIPELAAWLHDARLSGPFDPTAKQPTAEEIAGAVDGMKKALAGQQMLLDALEAEEIA
jgi:hypothetical protein